MLRYSGTLSRSEPANQPEGRDRDHLFQQGPGLLRQDRQETPAQKRTGHLPHAVLQSAIVERLPSPNASMSSSANMLRAGMT